MRSKKKRIQPVILVFDDNPVITMIVKKALSTLACEIHIAHELKVAREIMESNPPDLILLDVVMPKINGFDFAREARKKLGEHEVSIVFVTNKVSLNDLEFAYDIGAIDYIRKPFDLAELKIRVESALRMIDIKKDMQEKERLAGMQATIGSVVHNFNQPLTAAIFSAQMLERKVKSQEELKVYVDDIQRALTKLKKLIAKLEQMDDFETTEYPLHQDILDLD